MQASEHAFNLIKASEELRLEQYVCPAGKLTIGYGHTGKDVTEGMKITEKKANELLAKDVSVVESFLNKSGIHFTQGQFDALVSFTFNLGQANLASSTLWKMIKEGNFEDAENEFPKWCHVGKKVLPGLVKRRERERQLFTNGDWS